MLSTKKRSLWRSISRFFQGKSICRFFSMSSVYCFDCLQNKKPDAGCCIRVEGLSKNKREKNEQQTKKTDASLQY